jgi:hypothetical protein
MNQEKSMQHLKIEVKVDGKVVREYETTISTPKNAFTEFWALVQLFRDDMRKWTVNSILGNK